MDGKNDMEALLHAIEGKFIPNDFISEVEARPAIWDHTDPMYTRQASKKAAWDSLIKKFHPGFEDLPSAEQALISSHYRRKWKSFRDSFARELSKIKSSTKPRKTKYIYFQQLSFLLSMKGVPSSNIDDVKAYLFDANNEHFENDDSFHDNNNLKCIKSEPELSFFDVQQLQTTDNNHNTNSMATPQQSGSRNKRRKTTSPEGTEEDDEDKLFLMSLLSELRRVPCFMKLDVKCDLLNVFKHARTQYLNHSDNNNNSEQANNNEDVDNNNMENNNSYHSYNNYTNFNNNYNHVNGADNDAYDNNTNPQNNNNFNHN